MNSGSKHELPPPRLSYRIIEGFLWPLMKLARMSCREFARLASERLDRPLTSGERLRYVFHRILCGVCRPLPRQLEHLRHLSHCCGHEHEAGASSQTEMPEDAAAKIREALNREVEVSKRQS